MITLSPISKNIQDTLNKKIAMLKNKSNKSTPVYDKETGKWIDGEYSFNKPLSTDGALTQNYMFTRTPWLRMTSFTPMQGTNNTAVVLMGGELGGGIWYEGQDNEFSLGRMKSGFSNRIVDDPNKIVSKDGKINYEGLYYKEGNIPYRPIAGIKDISIEYKGGGMKLGATRTGEINWTCWDWEQLDRLTPHFLHHGKTVLLEWGWSGTGDLKDTQAYPLFKDGTLNYDNDKLNKLKDQLLDHIQIQNGHYDAMLGLVQNFDWSVNENGGFDCNTTIISPGITLLQSKQDEFMSLQKANLTSVIENVEGFWGDENKLSVNFDTSKELAPYITFDDYLDDISAQLLYVFENKFDKLKHQIIVPLKWRHKIYKITVEDGEVTNTGKNTRGDENHIHRDFLTNIDDKAHNTFITWGWFEDNVLNRFFSSVVGKELLGEIRSIKPKLDANGKIVKEDDKIIYDYTKFTDSKYVITTDSSKWLIPKLTDPVFGKMLYNFKNNETDILNISDSNVDNDVRDPDKNSSIIADNSDGVPIRNIYFNIGYLQKKLKGLTDLKTIVSTIWDDFSSEYGGVYKFYLNLDNENNRLVVREEGYSPKKDNDIVFEFPVWQDGSIVKSQTINAKLPDRMKIAAMYVDSKVKTEDGGSYDSIAAKAWGNLAKSMLAENGSKNMSQEEKDVLRFKDLISGDFDFPNNYNRNFGRINADINEQIFIQNTDLIGPPVQNPAGIQIGNSIVSKIETKATTLFQDRVKSKDKVSIEVSDEKDIKALNVFFKKELNSVLFGKDELKLVDILYNEISAGVDSKSSPKLKSEVLLILKSLMRGDKDGVGSKIQPLIPIEFELEIDGTGGMFPGNSFHSSYLSQRYKEEALFQMVGVGHKIDSSGWTTSIKGQIRAKSVNANKNVVVSEGSDENVVPEGIGVYTTEEFNKTSQGIEYNKKIQQEREYNIAMYGDVGGAFMNNEEIPIGYGTVLASATDMTSATFGNDVRTISGMANMLGVDQSVIEENLKLRYNWDGNPRSVQAGWTFPR